MDITSKMFESFVLKNAGIPFVRQKELLFSQICIMFESNAANNSESFQIYYKYFASSPSGEKNCCSCQIFFRVLKDSGSRPKKTYIISGHVCKDLLSGLTEI